MQIENLLLLLLLLVLPPKKEKGKEMDLNSF